MVMPVAEAPCLRLVGVSRVFGALSILSGIDLSVGLHERMAILGANGAGKTTLINLINGDLPVSEGTISLHGKDITAMPVHQRARMGLRRTYQVSQLFGGLTVSENVYLSCRGAKHGRFSLAQPKRDDAAWQQMKSIIATVHLDNVPDKLVSELSHGQQRQLEIGMALAGNPLMLLLDEPAAGLSPNEREMLTGILTNMDEAIGYILIEHDLDIALNVVDRVIVLHNGMIFREGRTEEIEQDSGVQAIYLGTSEETSAAA